jgi:hypothetical protein
MLWGCQDRWRTVTKGVTNYKTLLDQMARQKPSGERICLVTFNYDTLLEDALPLVGIRLSTIEDYVRGDYLVIKLHGSINWAHEVLNPIGSIASRSHENIASELIDHAPELLFGPSYRIIGERPIGRSDNPPWVPLFPALAIPVENKPAYECPEEHLHAMEELIPHVTKILAIGWRGSEARFLKSLAKGIQRDTRIMVVSSSVERATEVANKMRESGVAGNFLTASGGFSHVVLTREAENFLRSERQ